MYTLDESRVASVLCFCHGLKVFERITEPTERVEEPPLTIQAQREQVESVRISSSAHPCLPTKTHKQNIKLSRELLQKPL